jgi:hypothetical protein
MPLFWVVFHDENNVNGAIEANDADHARALVSLLFGQRIEHIFQCKEDMIGDGRWLLEHRRRVHGQGKRHD